MSGVTVNMNPSTGGVFVVVVFCTGRVDLVGRQWNWSQYRMQASCIFTLVALVEPAQSCETGWNFGTAYSAPCAMCVHSKCSVV